MAIKYITEDVIRAKPVNDASQHIYHIPIYNIAYFTSETSPYKIEIFLFDGGSVPLWYFPDSVEEVKEYEDDIQKLTKICAKIKEYNKKED